MAYEQFVRQTKGGFWQDTRRQAEVSLTADNSMKVPILRRNKKALAAVKHDQHHDNVEQRRSVNANHANAGYLERMKGNAPNYAGTSGPAHANVISVKKDLDGAYRLHNRLDQGKRKAA